MVIADEIDSALRELGSAERASHEKQYLKSSLTHYGASVPAIRSVARRFGGGLAHDEAVRVVEELWDRPVHECRMAAVELLDVVGASVDDLPLIERMLREARTWALVDGLAASVMGSLASRSPVEVAPVLDRWAADEDFWLRRSALLALLVPLRGGEGDWERFCRYADSMLDETQFFIRKAIGWVLRDTARRRPDLVYEWLLPRAGRASAVTLREALKPLSESQHEAIREAARPSS